VLKRAILLSILLVLLCGNAAAQFYYGKNKVQYTNFDWQVMHTEHFNIYFYEEEVALARTAAQLAETSYEVLSARYNHEIPRKVPLIIYSSPSYFSQTNILPYLLPESVGGFTEFIKGRVAVPFNGSYADFAHVVRHELVHAFMISRLDAVFNRQRRGKFHYPPLWFTEGLAEYWSNQWGSEEDMTLGDMVLSNRLEGINTLWRLSGTYYMYKGGESLLHFIDSTYGPDKIPLLFENWHKGKNFDEVVKLTLGDNLKDVSDKWVYWLKRRYYPELGEYGLPKGESKFITDERFAEKGVPITWDDGRGTKEWIIYKAYCMGYTGIYMKPLAPGGRERKVLVKGERSADYESLHILRSGIDANDSGLVVFSSKSKECDVLYILDLNENRVTQRYEFADLIEARSPRLSPEGDRVVFSGVKKDGYTNIYLLNLARGDYYAVTDDVFDDADPCFTIDGRSLVFSSDRCVGGPDGAYNLYQIDLDSRTMKQITFGAFADKSPECTSRGIYFSSDRNGFPNLFLMDHQGQLTEQSTYATGAFDPRLTSDGKRLTYTGYQDMAYRIYVMDLPEQPIPVEQPAPDTLLTWTPPQLPEEHRSSTVRYHTEYSFDIAQSAMIYDPVYGSLGGVQAAITDMLGNHAIHFLLTNSAQTKDEFLESFNVGVTYINRKTRINKGLGLFHLYDEYYNDYDKYYYERQAGALGFVSYPFSKFSRVDLTTVARYSKRDSRYNFNNREAFLVSSYISYVYDNSIWDISGPIDGRRYHFTLGHTTSMDGFRSFNRTAIADIRHYFRLGTNSALANRMFAYTSAGLEPQRIYFGGSWSFRGFDRRAFYNRNVLFSSTELRFPLIDVLAIGFPFGGLSFQGIRGALFYDTGAMWDDNFDQFLGSFGAGFRVAIGYVILLRFDFSRTHDYETMSPNTDFDFFFGWNF